MFQLIIRFRFHFIYISSLIYKMLHNHGQEGIGEDERS